MTTRYQYERQDEENYFLLGQTKIIDIIDRYNPLLIHTFFRNPFRHLAVYFYLQIRSFN